MTIYDISEKAGVSIATVSRVLNGSSNVSEKTKMKVLDTIEQYGYTPNAFARGLGLNTMKTIGIMCADSSDIYLAKAIYYIEQKLRVNGYDSILSCTGYEHDSKAKCINLLINKKVDGIILVGSNFVYEKEVNNRYIAEAAKQVPVMILNAQLDLPNVYCIITDDYASMYNAANKLIETGIKDAVYFYNSRSYSGKRKMRGFRTAMEEKGLFNEATTLQFYQGSHEDLNAMVAHLKKLNDSGCVFHGAVASDDTMAIACVKYAQEMGYKIPEEFSVIGNNNTMLAQCATPEVSSIDNKLESLCSNLINILMGVLSGELVPAKMFFSTTLVERGTTIHE